MIALTPGEAKVSGLIEEKEELLHILFNRLSDIYPAGLIEWMDQHRPEASSKISELEKRCNINFQTNASLDEFKAILRDYWVVYAEAIRNFNELTKQN